MGILTTILTIILVLTIFFLVILLKKDFKDLDQTRSRLQYIKSFGLFALVTGFLGQGVGLFQAFTVIQTAPDLSPAIMAGGLKVSMIAPMFGIFIFLISVLFWIGLDYLASHQKMDK